MSETLTKSKPPAKELIVVKELTSAIPIPNPTMKRNRTILKVDGPNYLIIQVMSLSSTLPCGF